MKILLVTNYYEPEVGAPQRRWANFAKRMTAAGHKLCVLAPVPHYPSGNASKHTRRRHPVGEIEYGAHGETIIRVPFREYTNSMVSLLTDQLVNSAGSVIQAAKWFRRAGRRPDVVVASVPGMPTLLAGHAIARLVGAPLAVEMRDAWPDLIRDGALVRSLSPAETAFSQSLASVENALCSSMTFLQRHADLVITTTESFAAELRARGVRDVFAVRNGIDAATASTAQSPDTGTPAGRPPDDEFHALYVGTVGRSQGLDTAVRAAAHAAGRGAPVRLRIVGDGASVPGLRALAARLDAPVEFRPPVSPDELPAVYAWADTHIVSLKDWPAFSMTVPSKLYEVMATGHHITGVLDGEAAEVLREANAGDVVAPGDVQGLGDLWAKRYADGVRFDDEHDGKAWVTRNADYDDLAGRYIDLLESLT